MKSRLRVLYLAPPSEQVGPLSRYSFLDEEIRALADAGVDAYVISRVRNAEKDDGRIHVRALPEDSFRERATTMAFMARRCKHIPPRNYADFRQVYRTMRVERFAAEVIRQHNVALVHSFFGWPRGFGGLVASAAASVPLIAGIRGSDVNMIPSLGYGSRLDPSFDRAVRALLRNADRMIFHSDFLRRQAIPLGAVDQKCHVILKGVRLDRFTGATAGCITLPVNRQQPIILAVSGLVPIKGLDHVLEALARVRAAGQTFSFIVCGDGDQNALRLKAAELGLSDVVNFRGKVPRTVIADYFASASMLVHGALIEAAGNVLLEAMASGVPVVCTDAGGPAEYVQHGKTGYVVPVADPDAMATRIIELLQRPKLRTQFGRAARQLAERAFSYDRMIDETIDVYRQVLS
jgi:glycosyltransferase involved in cell wall biosynthesis